MKRVARSGPPKPSPQGRRRAARSAPPQKTEYTPGAVVAQVSANHKKSMQFAATHGIDWILEANAAIAPWEKGEALLNHAVAEALMTAFERGVASTRKGV